MISAYPTLCICCSMQKKFGTPLLNWEWGQGRTEEEDDLISQGAVRKEGFFASSSSPLCVNECVRSF